MTRAAVMLFLWASFPLFRVVPSLRIRTGCPDPVVVKYAMLFLTSFCGVELFFNEFMLTSNENINLNPLVALLSYGELMQPTFLRISYFISSSARILGTKYFSSYLFALSFVGKYLSTMYVNPYRLKASCSALRLIFRNSLISFCHMGSSLYLGSFCNS